jgi:hypothetical protein
VCSTHSIHAAESRGYAGSNLKSQSQVSNLRHVPRSPLAAKEEKTILNATTHPYITSNEEPRACIIIAITIHHVA